jgi:AcrR family transcriptional regulator
VDASPTTTAWGADERGRVGEVATSLALAAPGFAADEQSARPDAAIVVLEDEPAADGRVARGQRTRRNVAGALIALLRDGDTEPTARAVAERAGVSLRLVFHHFADMDDLYTFVATRQFGCEWSTLPRLAPDLDLPARIDGTVEQRAELFERISAVRRAIARRSTSAVVQQANAASDALLRERLEHTFAPELDALAEPARGEQLEAMDTVSSWEAWDRMRRTSDLDVGAARRIMARLLAACCLSPAARPPAGL